VQVGEVYRVRTEAVLCEGNGRDSRPRVPARVVWVHPKGRFALLDLGGHKECYYPEQLTERNKVKR
jgi:hypothetical protein